MSTSTQEQKNRKMECNLPHELKRNSPLPPDSLMATPKIKQDTMSQSRNFQSLLLIMSLSGIKACSTTPSQVGGVCVSVGVGG